MKISFSLRAFVVYFIILGGLTWFILDKATEKLSTAFQQSSETVLVDTATLLATSLEQQFRDQVLDTNDISALFEQSYQRRIGAQIYSLYKDSIDIEIYITNRNGIVVYDSTGKHEGKDFSRWRDVRLTLDGKYGARTSYRNASKTNEGDEKVLVVASPITVENSIVGVLSVVKPVRPLEQLLAAERENLKTYILMALAIAMLVGYLVSYGFTRSISRLVDYAHTMARGKRRHQPEFLDKRFDNLATAITEMREQLDGKEYVEHYIHGLTHELKTPLTAIGASAELLSEGMPIDDQGQFIDNIRTANHRMQLLVERMLDLTKLENLEALTQVETFELNHVINDSLQQSDVMIVERQCQIRCVLPDEVLVMGDKLLMQQCISNLIDNAIENSPQGGKVRIEYDVQSGQHRLVITNSGHLEDFVLTRAFERFFSMQSEQGIRKRTGLGLPFAKEIIGLHQGTIELENTDQGIQAVMMWPMYLAELT